MPAYDPDRARAPLAEAGYPAGFRLSLHTYGDRPGFGYGSTAPAIAQMWTRIGVQTAVEPTPTTMYMGRGARREFSMPVISFGISTEEVGYALTNLFLPGFSGNWGGYDNPALTTLTNQALATLDPLAREKMLVQATEMLTDDIGFIPLDQLVNSWASRKGVIYEPRTDQRSVAMSARPE